MILFGPVSPQIWGPPPQRARHVALWAGARGDPHADRPAEGLLAITPRQVRDAIERCDAEPAPATRLTTA